MEHFIRIAFWIVALFGCLQAKPTPSDWRLKELNDTTKVNCPEDSTFYTPRNVKEHCITTALDCVLSELGGTAKEECHDPEGHINDAAEHLNTVINERKNKHTQPQTKSSECACERWNTTHFKEFLTGVESLLQLTNSQEANQMSTTASPSVQ